MIKTGYEHKFKDRKPEETIAIIRDFFKSSGFEIFVRSYKTSYGTWCSSIFLYLNNIFLLSTSGKGTSEAYSVASGLGEMYERVCCFYLWERDILFKNSVLNDCLQSADVADIEPFLSILNATNTEKQLSKLFSINSEPSNLKEFTDLLTNKKYVLNEKVVNKLMGSSGKACGNSFVEAFNQGFSELVEREVFKHFLENETEKLHQIKTDSIKNELLLDIINQIKDDGKEIYIIDMSWTTKMPVIMVILLDKISSRFTIDFGCFPVFEIALERCLTEICQNIGFSNLWDNSIFQIPGISTSLEQKIDSMKNSASFFFGNDENVFTRFTMSDINYKVFLHDFNNGNEEIYSYWVHFIKEQDVDVFVADCSLSKDIYAVSIFSKFGRIFSKDSAEKILYFSDFNLLNDYINLRNCFSEDYNFSKFKSILNKVRLIPLDKQISIINEGMLGEGPIKFFKTNIIPSRLHESVLMLLHNSGIPDFAGCDIWKKEINKLIFDKDGFINENRLNKSSLDYDSILEFCFFKPLWEALHEKGGGVINYD